MKPKFQTMVLKFIKPKYEDENFEDDCKAEIDVLCLDYDMEVTNMTFYERTRCLSATLKRKKGKVEIKVV